MSNNFFDNLRQQLETANFPESQRAEKLLLSLAGTDDEGAALHRVLEALIHDLLDAPDALLSLLNLTNVADKVSNRGDFLNQLQDDNFRGRLCRVLSWAQSLADTLIRRSQLLDIVRRAPQEVSRPQLRVLAQEATQDFADEKLKIEALRRFRREQTLRIGLLDMELHSERDEDDFRRVVHQISDLAIVCVQATLRVLDPQNTAPFFVIGMGKLGARELNYSSDIDLVFVHDGDATQMNSLGERLLKALGDNSPAGAMFRVDMRLRPDGKSGTLATSLGYALSYYESYAAAWEWQAMIKSRAIAGDASLSRRFRKFVRGVTWARRTDDAHLQEVVDMKRRSEGTPEGRDLQNVKQGAGAIRDAEWIVQQLQMMIGPSHQRARVKSTLNALTALHEFGALSFDEERDLRDGYLFLRVLEHRLQLRDERAVRVVPKDIQERAALARRMEFVGRGEAVAKRLDEEHAHHRAKIRALCEKLFWGWRGGKDEIGKMKDESSELQVSGFLFHPSEDAQRRLERLANGTPTRPLPSPLSRQIRAVLPDATREIEHAADPQRAVANLENLCEASGNRLSLLRSLAQAPRLARAVYAILGGSQRLSDSLIAAPQLLDLAANQTVLAQSKTAATARAEARDYVLAFRDRAAAMRRWRARELVRIGLRDLVLDASPIETAREISDLAASCIALGVAQIGDELRPASENIAFGVMGMGKLGGGEMHYASDCDVMFAFDSFGASSTRNSEVAVAWAEKLMRWVGERTADGQGFEMDARLRPEGQSGALARNVASFIEYFERQSGGLAAWERQALTRSRFVAGDPTTAAKLQAAIRHVAFPTLWQPEWSDELRHIKTRVENERGKRATDIFDVKLGSGTLSDIEWTAQWLAMKYGAQFLDLQTPNTLRQIEGASQNRVLDEASANDLTNAYLFFRRAELRLQITQENAPRVVKRGSKEFINLSRALFPDESTEVAQEKFEEQWSSSTRCVRQVFERVRDAL
jgi:glutamate-ammonia-ligase adenylyltransferase